MPFSTSSITNIYIHIDPASVQADLLFRALYVDMASTTASTSDIYCVLGVTLGLGLRAPDSRVPAGQELLGS